MESNTMLVCIPSIPSITYKEYLRVWHGNSPSDFGLRPIVNEVKSSDDVDDLDMFEVIDEKLWLLAKIKYGF